MMDFAIVAEGYTDQMVLKHILLGFFGDAGEEPLINFEQPLLDTTSQQAGYSPGGWDLVIKYFQQGKYKQALQLNRYLIVHIDTDVSESYGVAKHQDGQELTPETLVAAVVERFRGLIDEDIYNRHGERFLFAIAVHSIECWLLPLVFDNDKKAKITGCLEAIDHERRKDKLAPLSSGSGKNPDSYAALSRPYRKHKELMRHADANPSLRIFLETLAQRNIQLPPAE
jgi:hypothetical protein